MTTAQKARRAPKHTISGALDKPPTHVVQSPQLKILDGDAMTKKWVTADQHFGKLSRFRQYAFKTVEDHDRMIIDRHNSLVAPADYVYHLGDFCACDKVKYYLDQLNGIHHLLRGNHDWEKRTQGAGFRWIKDNFYMVDGDIRYFFAHYPHLAWPSRGTGMVHLHGHIHDNEEGIPHPFRIDMGVDCNAFGERFTPVNLADVTRWVKMVQPEWEKRKARLSQKFELEDEGCSMGQKEREQHG